MILPVDVFKQAMTQFATGVTVVTTHHDGKDHGITANAFSSVSIDPLLLLICIGKQQYAHRLLHEAGIFAVHILGAEHQALAERFAGMVKGLPDRFSGLSCARAATGAPILPGAITWLDCRIWNEYDGGTHTIFVGEVVEGRVVDGHYPLIYYQRKWVRAELDMTAGLPPELIPGF